MGIELANRILHPNPAREGIRVRGHVTIDILDGRTLKLLDRLEQDNLIVSDGRRYLGTLLKGAISAPTHVAVGTDNTAPASGDTALAAEVFRDFITQRITITDGARMRFFLPTTAANGNTLTEAGLFGPTPVSLMMARVTYTGIAKTTSIAINYAWDITFS
jgi:hypothetical protein